MKFSIPKDYQAPEGAKEGDEFQDIATFKFEGKEMEIVAIGEKEIPIGGEDKKAKPKGAKQAIQEKLDTPEDEVE